LFDGTPEIGGQIGEARFGDVSHHLQERWSHRHCVFLAPRGGRSLSEQSWSLKTGGRGVDRLSRNQRQRTARIVDSRSELRFRQV